MRLEAHSEDDGNVARRLVSTDPRDEITLQGRDFAVEEGVFPEAGSVPSPVGLVREEGRSRATRMIPTGPQLWFLEKEECS